MVPQRHTTKTVAYYKVLRGMVDFGREGGIVLDDFAPGHNGKCPDEFLATMNVERLRIPKGSTWVFQPADRPSTNFRLKALLRKVMRKRSIEEKLQGQAYQGSQTSLTLETREYVGEVLYEVMQTFNENEKYREGVRQAFDETVMPDSEPHKALAKLLELTEDLDFPEPNEKPFREVLPLLLFRSTFIRVFAVGRPGQANIPKPVENTTAFAGSNELLCSRQFAPPATSVT